MKQQQRAAQGLAVLPQMLSNALANNGTSGTIATVPTGYRPAVPVYVQVCANANLGSTYATIGTNGVVTIHNSSGASITATTGIIVSASYVI